MEAMMIEQMSFGGVGQADFQGDFSASTWMDGLMNALQSDLVGQDMSNPQSLYVDVSPTHSHSSYNDSLSSMESTRSSTTGGGSLASIAQPIVSDDWFSFAPTTMQSSGGVSNRSAPGTDQIYSSGQQRFASAPQMSRNIVVGSTRSQHTKDGSAVANMSTDGSVSSSITSTVSASPVSSTSNYGGSPVPNSYMNTRSTGEYQYPEQTTLVQKAQVAQQRQQQTSSIGWSGQSQQQRQYQQHPHHQIQQQQPQPQLQPHQQRGLAQQQFQQQQVPSVGVEEDPGLRLVHLLIACAQSIQRRDLYSAEGTVMKINQALQVAPQQGGPMSKVAAHFAEALTKRIYGTQLSPNSQESLIQQSAGISPSALSEILHFQFYETCPYLKFSHFTANQAILEAFKGAQHVHVIDFNLNHGLQWPALIQALALRPGGPPVLRLTGIGPPEAGEHDDSLKQIGMDLAKLAESLKVKFEFRGVVANKLDDIKMWMLQVRPDEVVAVNSMMQLHKLLYSDGSNSAGIDEVLRTVKSLKPKIIAMSEQEANYNSPNFLERFMEALHFYSSMFDSLEASNCPSGSEQQMLAEMYLGREICNIVACEGAQRLERHETLDQWRIRLRNAGFTQIHMGPNAIRQASMLLSMYSGQGYRVQDNQGCLTLCWHDRPLIAASAWHCS